MKIVCVLGLAFAAVASAACDPSDDERCGTGFTFEKDHCNMDKDQDESTDLTPANTLAGDAGSDGAVEDGTVADLPTGMGESCKTNDDCAGYDANFCPFNPESGEGTCTIRDCTGDNDGVCPTDWRCCDFPDFIPYPPFCIPAVAWEDLNNQMGCTG